MPPTNSSRATTSRQNHRGAASSMMMAIVATMNRSRSTVGSKILPNSLTWLNRRAMYPSTQSVAPRPPSSQAAAARLSRANRR
jgi:hypothetical protein